MHVNVGGGGGGRLTDTVLFLAESECVRVGRDMAGGQMPKGVQDVKSLGTTVLQNQKEGKIKLHIYLQYVYASCSNFQCKLL